MTCSPNNLDTTGMRIRYLRKQQPSRKNPKRKLSQDEFSELIGCNKSTVVAWEGGAIPETDKLLILADFFGVSTDYLLCRIEEKNHDVKFIHEETGLSEAAIIKLKENKNYIMFHDDSDKTENFSNIASSIIEHDRFKEFICRLMRSQVFRTTVTKHHKKEREEIEKAFYTLHSLGYDILAPGENNIISINDAKQEIGSIIDDLFRFKEKGYIELRY